jgi:hypothetical protein
MNIVPRIEAYGDKEKALTLKGKALAFYQFVLDSMGNVQTINRTEKLDDSTVIQAIICTDAYGTKNGILRIYVDVTESSTKDSIFCTSFNAGIDQGTQIYVKPFPANTIGKLITPDKNPNNLILPQPTFRVGNGYWADEKNKKAVSWDYVQLNNGGWYGKIAINGVETDNSWNSHGKPLACALHKGKLLIVYSSYYTWCNYTLSANKLSIHEFYGSSFYIDPDGLKILGFMVNNKISFDIANDDLKLIYTGGWGGNLNNFAYLQWIGYISFSPTTYAVTDRHIFALYNGDASSGIGLMSADLINDVVVAQWFSKFGTERTYKTRYYGRLNSSKNVGYGTGAYENNTQKYNIFDSPDIGEEINMEITVHYDALNARLIIDNCIVTSKLLGVISNLKYQYELYDKTYLSNCLIITLAGKNKYQNDIQDIFSIKYDVKNMHAQLVKPALMNLSVTAISRSQG